MTRLFGPQLASMRLVLERARLLLRDRDDDDARALLVAVSEQIGLLAALETEEEGSDISTRSAHATSGGHALVMRVRAYADVQKILFVANDTPYPRTNTRRMSTEEIRAAIDTMPERATEPPPEVAGELLEAQRLSDADPPITLREGMTVHELPETEDE